MTQIRNCARCNGDHDLKFTKLNGDPIETPEGKYTHWAMCPNTNQPIMMMMNAQTRDPEVLKKLIDWDLEIYGNAFVYDGYRIDPTKVVMKGALYHANWKNEIVWVCGSCYPEDYTALALDGVSSESCSFCGSSKNVRAAKLWWAAGALRDMLSKAIEGYIGLLKRLDSEKKQIDVLNEAYDRMAGWREKLWTKVDTMLDERSFLADCLDEAWKRLHKGHESLDPVIRDRAKKAMERIGRELSCEAHL